MKQKLLSKVMLLLFALIAGSSSVWATDTTKDVTLSSGSFVTDHIEWTLDDVITIQQTKGSSGTAVNSSYVSAPRVYKGHVLSFVAETGYAIKSISITYATSYKGNSMTAGTTISDNTVTDNTTDVDRTWATVSSGTHVVSSVSDEGLSTIYIQNVASGTNTQLRPTAISITYASTGGATKVATPVISGAQKFLTSTTVTITCATDGAAIKYTTDNGDSWNNYSTPFTLTSTTTVKAKATNGVLTDSDVSDGVTFTKVTPQTVTEALTAVSALASNGTIADQCVSGIVCTAGSFNSGAITYYISADGTETNRLQVYKGKGLNNADFEAAGDIAVGDEVVVYGTLKNYNGTTPEFDQGNYLLSKVRKPSPELAWSAASYTATYGESITYPTLTNPNSVTVAFSSSDTNVATIDPSTGEITIKANGETVITASFAGDATYRAQDVTYTLTVAGMKLSPGFSFAEAEVNMAYDEAYTGQSLTNPNSLDVTYESSDTDVADVDENTGELALYKAGTVTITANYAGDATYASGSASYTINVTKAAAGLAFASVGPFSVAPDADFDVPAFTNPHSLTVVWSSSDEDVAVANATTAVIGSKTGTAVITASFAGDDCYNASEVSYTIVVTNDIEVTWDLSTDQTATATEDEMTWTNANVTMEAAKGSATTATNNYYPGTSGKTYTSTRFYKNSTLTITPLNGFAIKSVEFTATTEAFATALASSTWTNATAVASSMKVTITPTDGTNAISAVIGANTGHSSVVVNLGKSFDVKLNSAGFATFAAPAPLDYSDDSEFSAWQITDANSSTGVITFSQITGAVAAGTGVLLMGTPSATVTVPVAASGSDISGTNKLVGIITDTEVADDAYYGLSGTEFKKVSAGTVPAGKALLDASKVGEVKAFTFVFEDATGIESIQNSKSEIQNAIFDLSGRRVSKATKGLYIVNGKKVVK